MSERIRPGERVEVTEVGPRDGLQNEKVVPSTAAKIAFIEALVDAGARQIEVGSFVSPRWVPAMADSEAVFAGLTRQPGVRYLALVPNQHGYQRAVAAGCDAVAVFTAASEGFARANINTTIAQSLSEFRGLAAQARAEGVAVRGYVSTVFACPYDGPTRPEQVVPVVEELLAMGCYEVSLGDTIGVGTPSHVERLLDAVLARVPAECVVMHFHDTWGMGAANAWRALELGVRRFDASAGGLGGCPFAKVATGNVATEDLLYLFANAGLETGYDLAKVARAVRGLAGLLDHPLASRVHKALGPV
ncbi:MAG: hydroxymethylglutaryl-CoA lyase [Deltaproteobacteria bacterium]|nr:hydroxymethylglutaryl-CoA lyase [Deltaproteobacteria bacterium]